MNSGRLLRSSRAFDWALAALVLAIWYHRFGSLGPFYNSDAAVTGAMALRPFSRETFYFWGGQRQGSFVPWVASLLVLGLHLDAAVAGQLVGCLCSAAALGLFLSFLRWWPWKLALAAFFAFPQYRMAEMLCGQGSMMPATLLFLALELWSFERAYREPSPGRAAGTSLLLGLALWSGENVLPLVPLQLAAVALRRGSPPWKQRARTVGAAVLGFAPPAALIAIGKHTGKVLPEYLRTVTRHEAWENLVHLDWQLTKLLGTLSASETKALGVGLALAATAVLALGARRTAPRSPALAWAAPLAAAMTVETCFSYWYVFGGSRACYFTLPVALLVVAAAWSLDELTSLGAGAARFGARAFAVPAACWLCVSFYRQGRKGDQDIELVRQGPAWRERAAAAEKLGCKGLVGNYWDSYTYFTLSQGRIVAGAKEGDARVEWLTREALRQPLVCAVPWWSTPGCPPTLRQYGQELDLVDERFPPPGTADPGQFSMIHKLRFCAYRPRP
ncbi:MAG: hypothetical protein ACYDCL_13290 [Myxococcales bacterium]